MKYACLFFTVFHFCFLSASTQITSFGHPFGIVTDTKVWECKVKKKGHHSLLDISGDHIKGYSRSQPLMFEFYHDLDNNFRGGQTESKEFKIEQDVLNYANKILKKYAIESSSLIKDTSIKGDSNTRYTVSGSFTDNKSSGFFAMHLMQDYTMFVLLRGEFDEGSREFLLNSPLDLITSLYSPKALFKIMGVEFENYTDCIILEE